MIFKGLLPLKDNILPNGASELSNAEFLIDSLDRNWCSAKHFELYVVTSDSDFDKANNLLRNTDKVRVLIFPESEFFTGDDLYFHMPGWWKQQLVKLWCSYRLFTGFYITFDTDVFALNNFDEHTFMNSSKCVSNWVRLENYPFEWTQNTSKTLFNIITEQTFRLNVTPNILHTTLSQNTFNYLSREHGDSFKFLHDAIQRAGYSGLDTPWTEYDLYLLINQYLNTLEDIHLVPWRDWHTPNDTLISSATFFSNHKQFINFKNKIVNGELTDIRHTVFGVRQSTASITNKSLKATLSDSNLIQSV